MDKYHCEVYQRHKLDGPGYGLLPECKIQEQPWEEVAVDPMSPWKIKVSGREIEFNT